MLLEREAHVSCCLKVEHMFLPCAQCMPGSWNCWKHSGTKCWLQWVDHTNCFEGHLTVILPFQTKLFFVEVKNFEERRDKFLAWNPKTKFSDLKRNKLLERWFKMLKVSHLMATSLKILITNTQFSVALVTSWSQFQTLYRLSKVVAARESLSTSITGFSAWHPPDSIKKMAHLVYVCTLTSSSKLCDYIWN